MCDFLTEFQKLLYMKKKVKFLVRKRGRVGIISGRSKLQCLGERNYQSHAARFMGSLLNLAFNLH